MRSLIDLHMHTIASTHAFSTLQELITQAKARSLKAIAITDHGVALDDSPHEWHFSNQVIIPRIIDDVVILKGIEANILDMDGNIDCSDKMFNYLDIVLAGFHDQAMPPMDVQSNTTAMISAIKNPKVNIISHPGNKKYPIDIEQVVKAAKQHHVALEINNSSPSSRANSEMNCLQIASAVKEIGGYLSLGSDAHISYHVGHFEHCYKLLDSINFPEDKIINLNGKRLMEFLKIKTGKHIPELLSC